ncbi:CDP-glycerol glycerophosphotransferase family protein [Aliikangiella sp. IMCC44632]
MFKKIIITLLNFINFITPKYKNKTVFIGYPDYDDMLRGVIDEIDGELIVLVNNLNVARPIWLNDGVIVCEKNGMLGYFHLFTSSRLIYTHGVYCGFKVLSPTRQYVLNLWHGMPLKKIGALLDESVEISFHRTIATSEFFVPILSKCFQVDERQVCVTALPRNKALLTKFNGEVLTEYLKRFSAIHMWLPTYRKCEKGITENGNISNMFGLDGLDLAEINRELALKKYLLIIKPHPMSASFDENVNYSNILFIDERWLLERHLTLYETLSVCDVLWTDYSSIFIDFLITGREIKFIVGDLESYNDSRGFTFDLTSCLGNSPIITTQQELVRMIRNEEKSEPLPEKLRSLNTANEFSREVLEYRK